MSGQDLLSSVPQVVRWALGIQYVGDRYLGWQRQAQGLTVQGALEHALSVVADEPIHVMCAGRTDQGVHAWGQVVHFETQAVRPGSAWIHGAHTHLSADIRVSWAQRVPQSFHARFSASGRTYLYLIWKGSTLPPFWHRRALLCVQPLNLQHMQEAAGCLLGEHDFSSFRGADCQSRTPMRCVKSLSVGTEGSFVLIQIEANAFLHHMVRNIVGLLFSVGRGKHPPSFAAEVLRARNRAACPAMAPAWGLYLKSVDYPGFAQIPQVGSGFCLGGF